MGAWWVRRGACIAAMAAAAAEVHYNGCMRNVRHPCSLACHNLPLQPPLQHQDLPPASTKLHGSNCI
eukprot:1917475-Prorocentrum_lima.AAC.1